MTPNEKHLKILSEVIGQPVSILTNELSAWITDQCLAAMQTLQSEIDQLQTKYTALHDLTKFCQCDDPDFYTGNNTQCKRCNRPFDPELS